MSNSFVALKSTAFQGPSDTNYVNASRIMFDGLEQTFIACQAPKPGSFSHFWQMVMEEEVEVIVMVTHFFYSSFKVIVMVTQLVERTRVKANQYWPDKDNCRMDLKDEAWIQLLDTSFQGNYHIR